MARPWRIQFPGAVYHVTARGNNRQVIFRDDHDRQDFLSLISRGQPRFNLQVFAFCLMSNHYHLFLRTSEPNLSVALHWLNATYTIRFHRRHRSNGHLLQGRFKSVLVVSDRHWLHLSMYLHLNPVRAGLADDPAAYPWSSFLDFTRLRPRYDWLQPQEVLSRYGQTPVSQRRRYRRECLVLAGKPGDLWQELRHQAVLGPKEVYAELVRKYRPSGKTENVPEFTRRQRPAVDPEKEIARLARTFGVQVSDLTRKRRNFPPRFALYHHLVENCGLSLTQVADLLQIRVSSVSMGLQAFRNMTENDRQLRTTLDSLNFK